MKKFRFLYTFLIDVSKLTCRMEKHSKEYKKDFQCMKQIWIASEEQIKTQRNYAW